MKSVVGSQSSITEKRRNNDKEKDDTPDSMPEKLNYNCLYFFGTLGAIFTYIFDVGTDVALIYFYYKRGDIIYFGLTITFVALPAISITVLSLKWYWMEYKNSEGRPHIKPMLWFFRIIFHFFLIGCVWRSIESMYFGCKSTKTKSQQLRKKYYKFMITNDADTSLLRLIETFLESAPQLVLQIFILVKNAQVIKDHFMRVFNDFGVPSKHLRPLAPFSGETDVFLGEGPKVTLIIQLLSISSAIVSLAWAMTAYARNCRFDQEDKKNISTLGTIFYFLWHLLTVGARVLALSLFASVLTYWICVPVICRFTVMTTCIMILQEPLSDNKCQQKFIEFLFGFVYLFAFINIKDEPTRRKYLFFYAYEIVEDTILVALWLWAVDPITAIFYWAALASYFGGSVLGLTCMIVYYAQFHPNGPRRDLNTTFLSVLLPPQAPLEKSSSRSSKILHRTQWNNEVET